MTESTRRDLCKFMVFAQADKSDTILLQDNELVGYWNIICLEISLSFFSNIVFVYVVTYCNVYNCLQLDSWSVIINGSVLVVYPDGEEEKILGMGYSFGVEPHMGQQRHKGTMYTMVDECQVHH